tara:strand:+ start:124 stop:312 length:189 start_codon:yes stop_codon:yes gene_type:complete
MKIPEQWKAESTHKTNPLNTMALIGVSFLWAHFLGLISPWFIPLTVLTLIAAYGSELNKRDK